MNRLDQARRDHQIAADAASGVEQAALARRYDVSERTVRRALVRAQRNDRGSHERLADFNSRVDSAIEQLAVERVKARSPRTRIAAINLQMNLLKERKRLLVGPAARSSTHERDRQVAIEFAASLIALAVADELDEDVLAWLKRAAESILSIPS